MTPKKIEWVKHLLRKTYGTPVPRALSDPLDELVQTILSQNTTDQNSQRAFDQLKAAFPTWNDVMGASPDRIAQAIRSGGLAEIKSQRIVKVLRTIQDREGVLSLKRICAMPLNEALAYLTDLDGVGIKTACCVLLFACGRPVMPVDTHVYRLSQRLGWVNGSVPIQKAHEELHKLVEPAERYAMHMLLIRHGREVCHALRPACVTCALTAHCPSAAGFRNDHPAVTVARTQYKPSRRRALATPTGRGHGIVSP